MTVEPGGRSNSTALLGDFSDRRGDGGVEIITLAGLIVVHVMLYRS